MYKLDAAAFMKATTTLDSQAARIGDWAGQQQGAQIAQSTADSCLAALDVFEKAVEPLRVPMTRLAIAEAREAFKRAVEMKLKFHECGQLYMGLSVSLRRELTVATVYVLDSDRAHFYEPPGPPFGAAVSDAFPSSRPDIDEAGKCYALERSTACVMHLMRALETPLVLLGGSLGVTTSRAAWGDLLRPIREAIGKLPNSDPRQAWASEAAVQFRFFKNSWRDHAMHARTSYQSDEALVILNATKALMQTLAAHLHE